MTHYLGIDLGTTNSAVAVLDADGRVEVVPNTVTGHPTTPSIVYFQEQTDVAVGDIARNAAVAEPENVISLVKRSMGEAVSYPIHGIEHTPESISALILRHLYEDARSTLGRDDNGVVITVPAYFGMRETQATVEAGTLAGLNVLATIPEPIAAALHYGRTPGSGEETLLVFDLGGGTFDTSLLRIGADAIDTVVIDGDRRLGGADWDRRIADWLIDEFCTRTGCDETDLDAGFRQQLLQQTEAAKVQLSQVSTTRVPIRFGAHAAAIELTREKYEELTRDLLDRTIAIVRRTLATGTGKGIEQADVTDVLLVGGATLMPAVTRRLREEFGWEGKRVDPHLAVVKGAALYAASLRTAQGGEPVLSLPTVRKVLPRSFGVRLDRETSSRREDLYIEYIAHANDPLPITDRRLVTYTKIADVSEQAFHLFEQNADVPSPVVALNREVTPDDGFVFTGLPNLPQGSPMTIVVNVDEDGLAHVEAFEDTSGQRLQTRVQLGVLQQDQLAELEQAVAQVELLH